MPVFKSGGRYFETTTGPGMTIIRTDEVPEWYGKEIMKIETEAHKIIMSDPLLQSPESLQGYRELGKKASELHDKLYHPKKINE